MGCRDMCVNYLMHVSDERGLVADHLDIVASKDYMCPV